MWIGEVMTLPVAVDFNTMLMDPEERVVLNTAIDPHLQAVLRPGLAVVLYDETLEVEAVAELAEPGQRWMARPNWQTSRDLPPPTADAGTDQRRLTANA